MDAAPTLPSPSPPRAADARTAPAKPSGDAPPDGFAAALAKAASDPVAASPAEPAAGPGTPGLPAALPGLPPSMGMPVTGEAAGTPQEVARPAPRRAGWTSAPETEAPEGAGREEGQDAPAAPPLMGIAAVAQQPAVAQAPAAAPPATAEPAEGGPVQPRSGRGDASLRAAAGAAGSGLPAEPSTGDPLPSGYPGAPGTPAGAAEAQAGDAGPLIPARAVATPAVSQPQPQPQPGVAATWPTPAGAAPAATPPALPSAVPPEASVPDRPGPAPAVPQPQPQ
ncbi:hypothetical protein EXY23_25195, partial [Roseicella aquatilis]